MLTSESIAALSPSLVLASAEIEGATKAASNDHFKSKYATLEKVIEATRETLAKHDLCVIQAPGGMTGRYLTMTTRLLHKSGEWIEAEYQIPIAKEDPQASGSAITYARRYALMSLLNVPAVDDDGEAAMERSSKPITQGQVKELEALIEQTGTAPDLILKYAKVSALGDIAATEFLGIKTKLEAKLPSQKQAA